MDTEDLAKDEAVKPEVVNEETETPQVSPTEQKTETTEAPVEGEPAKDNTQQLENVPFHKHPRWQKLNQEKKQLEATVNDLLAFKQSVESKSAPTQAPATNVPEWFKNLYGDNPQVWTQYQSYEAEMRKQIQADAVKELKAEQEQQTQEVTKWNNWVENQFDELEDTGKTFDRNAFRKFILDYNAEYKSLPLTDKGDIDIAKCYELMLKLSPPSTNTDADKIAEKKKLAGKQSTTSGTTPSSDKAISLQDLRGKRDWRDF